MAVKNAIYQVDNGSGFDEIHFKTKAAQVICEDGLTSEDKLGILSEKSKFKYSTAPGKASTAGILNTAYTYIGGKTTPHGVYLVTIRDSLLNQYYVGVHNYSKDTFHKATKIAGELNVNVNNAGTIVTTTGNLENQTYGFELLSHLA